METKDELVMNIKEWIKMDTEISKLQTEIKERKNKKKQLSEALMDVMKKNEIDCFDINNGQICYDKKNIKKPITKKALLDILSKFYKGDSLKAGELNTFILDNREETIKESIILKMNKS